MGNKFEDAIAHLAKEDAQGKKFELPQQRITFDVQPSVCQPGAFKSPFKLTLTAATPAMEAKAKRLAMRLLGGMQKGEGAIDPTTLLLEQRTQMAFVSIVEFDGQQLQDHEREMLWRLLGEGGRLLVGRMFSEHLTTRMSDEDAGKADSSLMVD